MSWSENGVLEGSMDINDGMNSGVYSIDNIEFMITEGGGISSVFDTVYNSEFYDDDSYNSVSLPLNIVEISGTRGEIVPEVDIKSSKSTFTLNEKIVITVDAVAEGIDFTSGNIVLNNTTKDKPFLNLELEKDSLGLLTATYDVEKYTAPGEYDIYDISLYTNDYDTVVEISNEKYSDFDEYNTSDFNNFSLTITGTVDDTVQPRIISSKVEKTELIYGDSIVIEVEALDSESGIGEVYAFLDSENDFKHIWLRNIGGNKYRGYFNFFINENIESAYTINVYAQDKQLNTVHYSDNNHDVRFSGNQMIRTISGSNRFNTAIEISRHFDMTNIAFLASGETFPDALAAGPMATSFNAPIYLAQKNRISQSTLDELNDKSIEHVIIFGGESAISGAVEQSLIAAGMSVKRIAGNNRFDTAIKIAKELINTIGRLMMKAELYLLTV